MGWGSGMSHDGREIGYSVEAECDEPGCKEAIDRGLSYLCGDLDQVLHDNGVGCGKYFCGEHLFFGARFSGVPISMCQGCWDRYKIDQESGDIEEDEDGEPALKQASPDTP